MKLVVRLFFGLRLFVLLGFFILPFCRLFLCFEHGLIASFVECWALLGALTDEVV